MSTTRSASTLVRSLRLLPVAAAIAGIGAFGAVPAAAPVHSDDVVVSANAKSAKCTVAVTKVRPTSALYTKCEANPGRF